MKGLEGLRRTGALELNTQDCDETQRKMHERDRLRIQYKGQRMNSDHRNRNTQRKIHERDRLRIQYEQKKKPTNGLRSTES